MLLKIKYLYQRFIKKRIDDALMRRRGNSKEKRKRGKMTRKSITSTQPPHSLVDTSVRPIRTKGILVFPLIEYSTLWDDADRVDPGDFLRGIPTLKILEFIIALQNKVLYAYSDIKSQTHMLYVMSRLFGGQEEQKVRLFIDGMTRRGMMPVLMDNYSCLHFFLLALQHYDGNDRPLTDDDRRNIFKAYLFCSHEWLNKQQREIQGLEQTDLSLRVDLPVVEFKLPKDFKVQLYKASRLFKFCDQDTHFGQFATWFLHDKGVENASEYLLNVFSLIANTVKDPIPVYLQIANEELENAAFFDQFVIDINDCRDLWNQKNFGYLRSHFLIKTQDVNTGETKLMILNALLMTDKLYQGMMFDMAECVIRNGGGNRNGKAFRNKGDFNAFIGEEFSEHLLYDALELAFPSNSITKLRGIDLKNGGVVGEPDYCIQKNSQLFIFEYKDVMMNDQIKQSSDITLIKETIIDRLCKFEQGRMKGAGQLLYSIDNIFNHHTLESFGIDTTLIKEVFPIVVTTDTAFNATGVNALIKDEFRKLLASSGIKIRPRIISPVIIDYETLFNLVIPLRKNIFDLRSIIYKYNDMTRYGSLRMMPFCCFVKDHLRVPLLRQEDVPVLFGEFMDMIRKN